MSFPFCAKTMIFGLLIVVTTVACRLTSYYRDNYLAALNKQHEFAQLAETRLLTINNMQKRLISFAALDAKYTRELADAQSTTDQLERDVNAGRKRLRVAGKCYVPSDSSPRRVGDDGTVELTKNAGQNILTIRNGIVSDQVKLRYLQQYVREQCLR